MADSRTQAIILALVEDSDGSLDSLAAQLIYWRYRVLPVRMSDLLLGHHAIQTVAAILTTKTRWDIERVMNGAKHPPIITTNDFDLNLRERIAACLRRSGLQPPA